MLQKLNFKLTSASVFIKTQEKQKTTSKKQKNKMKQTNKKYEKKTQLIFSHDFFTLSLPMSKFYLAHISSLLKILFAMCHFCVKVFFCFLSYEMQFLFLFSTRNMYLKPYIFIKVLPKKLCLGFV